MENQNNSGSAPLRLIRLEETLERLAVSKTEFYRMINLGKFPKPVKRGKTSSWPTTDIENYINEVSKARN